MSDTKTAPKAGEKKKRAPRSKKPDLVRLKALADEVGKYGVGDLTNLIHRLETEEGMKVRVTSKGRTYVKLAGMEVGARGDLAKAMRNWGNAARRAALKGGV